MIPESEEKRMKDGAKGEEDLLLFLGGAWEGLNISSASRRSLSGRCSGPI